MWLLEDVEAAIEQDSRELRAEFLALIPCLASEEVAQMASLDGSDGTAAMSSWRMEKRVFSIDDDGVELFPAFQLRDNAPHPTIAPVLQALDPDYSRWAVALWWAVGNGWLGGPAPMDLLDEPERLIGRIVSVAAEASCR